MKYTPVSNTLFRPVLKFKYCMTSKIQPTFTRSISSMLIKKSQYQIYFFNHSISSSLSPKFKCFEFPTRNISLKWLDEVVVSQSSIFQTLSQSTAVEKSMSSIQYVHDSLQLPWWISIILTTVLLRTSITFPLSIYQNYIFSKLQNLRPEMDELVKELKKETSLAVKKFKWDEKHARMMYNRSARRIWKELVIKENCHPFKASILMWVQIPLWVMLSMSFRNMAAMLPVNDANAQTIFMQMCVGGFGWLPNLTEADHSLILPVVMAISNILIVDVNTVNRPVAETNLQKYLGYTFKSLSILLIPIAAHVPGCVVLYWTTSSVYGLVQNLLLLHPRVRRLSGIPSTPTERSDPYNRLMEIIKTKYLFFKLKDGK